MSSKIDLDLFIGRKAKTYKETVVKCSVNTFLLSSLAVAGAFCFAGWQGFAKFFGVELIVLAISALIGLLIAWDG
jgi:hypothetical protein